MRCSGLSPTSVDGGVSRSDHAGATVPTEEYRINLDSHGFEAALKAPTRIKLELSRDANGQYLLEIEISEKDVWRVELVVDSGGQLDPRVVYHGEELVAVEGDDENQSVEQLSEWLQFVIEYVASEVIST